MGVIATPDATYTPNPGQVRIHNAAQGDQRHLLVYGGSRSGKTFEILRLIITRALRSPKSRHAIFRYRFNALRASIWLDTLPKVMEVCFPGLLERVITHTNDGYIELPGGSEIWMAGLDDKERTEKVLGQEYATMFFNEVSQIPYQSIQIALSRLAQKATGLRNRAYYDLNPVGTDHWSYRVFIQKVDPIYRKPLINPANYVWVQVNPHENQANIDQEYLASLQQYDARMRKRFLEGEYSADIEGALWTLDRLERSRSTPLDLSEHKQIVVAVDPSGTEGPEEKRSDEVGIIVCALGLDNKGRVLADRSTKLGPAGWGKAVSDAHEEFQADGVVAEKNFGGAMVKFVMRTANPYLKIHMVTASRGKQIRAQPISSLWEQDRMELSGFFPELEEQFCNFSTAGYQGARSPDRADAAIHGFTHLMIRQGPQRKRQPQPPVLSIYAR